MKPSSFGSVSLFALSGATPFGSHVAYLLMLPVSVHEEREFEDGEHKIRPLESVRNRHVYVVQTLRADGNQSVNDKLCKLLFFIAAVKDAGAAKVTVCAPYLAYARKDRRTQPHDPVTSRYVAMLMEAVGVDRILTLDVHNPAAYDNAFRIEAVHLEATASFARYFGGQYDATPEWVVVSPDIGGIKRAQRLRDLLAAEVRRPVHIAFIEKRRAGGIVSGDLLVGEVAKRRVLIIDDLISSGATTIRAVKACRQAGALRVDVAATHAVFSGEAQRLFTDEGPDSVVVTDSVGLSAEFDVHRKDRLTVLEAAPIFADAICEIEGVLELPERAEQ